MGTSAPLHQRPPVSDPFDPLVPLVQKPPGYEARIERAFAPDRATSLIMQNIVVNPDGSLTKANLDGNAYISPGVSDMGDNAKDVMP